MSLDALAEPFLKSQLFSSLEPLQMKALWLCGERVAFGDGEAVIREDEAGDSAYLVIAGEAVVVDQSTGIVTDAGLTTGTLIGEIAMLIEAVHGTTVVARGAMKALRFRRDVVHELMRINPTLADALMQEMTARLTRVAQGLRAFDEAFEQSEQLPALVFKDVLPERPMPTLRERTKFSEALEDDSIFSSDGEIKLPRFLLN